MADQRSSLGAVAAGHAATAGAAADILRAGGNAFDAVVAALWTACVAEPVLASPAGGGFVTARAAGCTPHVFDFFTQTPRATAPAGDAGMTAISADFGPANQQFHIGAGTVATPGFVPGLFAVHAAHGSLAMADLVAPAVALARTGLEVTPFQARLFEVVRPILEAEPGSRALFAPGGRLHQAGDRFANPALADTIDALGREGELLARDGALGREIVAALAGDGSHIALADLAGYAVVRRAPLTRALAGAHVHTNPPPAAGGALMLAILTLADCAGDPLSLAVAIDRVDRMRRGPSCDSNAPACDSELAAALGAIAPRAAVRGTTHVSVIDAAGNAAAATVSNGAGNGRIVAGFMLNNMLGEDDVNPGGLGAWLSDQRLASMMAPSLIDRRETTVALGSGGSNRIRTALARVVGALAGGTALGGAIEAPRLHVEAGHLDFEDLFDPSTRAALMQHFPDHHAWAEPNLFFGGAHAVARHRDGSFEAVGDPRRAGVGLVVGR